MARAWLTLVLAAAALPWPGTAQNQAVDFSVDRPHPRLLLRPRHRRRLQLECRRQTPRWRQFAALVTGGASLPEPGFARALYYVASGDREQGRAAVHWALTAGSDLRQLALVFDWCQPLLSPSEKQTLAGNLARRLETTPAGDDFRGVRDRLFAALAIADEDSDLAEGELRRLVERWWDGRIIPALRQGRDVIPRRQAYPLMEILHAIRDNLLIDLRRRDPHYFASLPEYFLLSYYPALYRAAGNDYHVPVLRPGEPPNIRAAALARAADLSLIAYDPNARGTQFLQGFSMRDSFQMRDPFGAPYEFLWANPYQPGLSYYNAPLALHDARDGRLLVRSSWDGGAKWFYREDGALQRFENGRIERPRPADWKGPIQLGHALLVPLFELQPFAVNAVAATTCYLIGLQPHAVYDVEVDDEELREARADAGGIVELKFPAGRKAGVRLHLRPQP